MRWPVPVEAGLKSVHGNEHVADMGLQTETVDVGRFASNVGHEVDGVLPPEIVHALHDMVVVYHQLWDLGIAAGSQLGPTVQPELVLSITIIGIGEVHVVEQVRRKVVAKHATGLNNARRDDIALYVVVLQRFIDDIPLVDVLFSPSDDVCACG